VCCAARPLRRDWDPCHATAACPFHDAPERKRANLIHAGSTHLRRRKINKLKACHRCLLEAYDIIQPADKNEVTKYKSTTARYVAFLAKLEWS